MKSFLLSVLALLLFACSEDSGNSVGNDNGDITSNYLSQLYEGSINFNITGGFTGVYSSDTTVATAITTIGGSNHQITFLESSYNIAFVGLTSGTSNDLKFVDSLNVQPGEIIGTINNQDMLVISKSGDFTLSQLDASKMKGSFSGVFSGSSITTNITATFDFTAGGGSLSKHADVYTRATEAANRSRLTLQTK